ncbi:hypothetical protein CLV62_11949 [Dysgonomonas alginatilytica]|uniref:Glycosyl transferase family 2 n=1 Tax=Dysgonomonas alginatilytica TaxID=1605892 RepID=A0A2V3PNS5_9BACT|nr:hypothetical protein [Dysgonomonas alginatilytica]PXV62507.1 hypothetical protein CLV62_11949 [Dysgonomonas alginatilytica]
MKLRSPEKKQSFLRRVNLYKYYSQLNKLLKVPAECSDMVKPQDSETSLDLITIAFNNVHVLKHQIRKIKENVRDDNYTHIVADNSNMPEKREEIRLICENEGVMYVGIPQLENNSFIIGSKSHGVSLNWVFYQVVMKRKPRWFGFLDHDIYPIRPVSIVKTFDNQIFYGKKETRDSYWYLWPGFSFFEFDFLADIKVDFSPSKIKDTYLDTGGALWYSLYSKLNDSDFTFAAELRITLDKLGYDYPETVEFIDDSWFHSMNASLWKDASDYSDAIDDILTKKDLKLI